MRSIIARPSTASPCGLSYFTGSLHLDPSGELLVIVPGTSWFLDEALVFPVQVVAEAWAALMSACAPGYTSFVVLPFLGAPHALPSGQEEVV